MDLATFDFDYTKEKQFTFGLFSDIHIDSAAHDRTRFEEDMSAIASKNGRIFFNGDLFDGIMPTDRKRYSRAGDTSKEDAQINDRVTSVVDRLKKYADFIDYVGYGNHEASILKYNNVDIVQWFVRELQHYRSKALCPIKRSGYVGFINLKFARKGECVRRFTIYRAHGNGGNSPVTLGTIALNRLYTTYSADLCWLGHSHNSLIDKSGWNIGVSPQGLLYRTPRLGLITAGYHKNFEERTWNDGEYYHNNFAEERFYTPTSLGHATLTLDLTGNNLVPDLR